MEPAPPSEDWNVAQFVCIDVEASGLSSHSYPIEVAVAFVGSDRVESWLIRPTEEWLATGEWDPKSEAVHGISEIMAITVGLSVGQVAEELAAAVADRVVLSDAPDYDGAWLAELYAAVGWTMPFKLRSVWSMYDHIASPLEVKLVQKMARESFPILHRAAPDAQRLAETLRLLLGLR